MAAIIKLRRGTKAQLDTLMSGTPMASGELGFTTDTKEVFVSDGTSAYLVGRVVVDILSSRPVAGVSGRLFHASDTGDTYVDNGAAWVLSGVSDLDDITDGTTYARVLASELDSGRVTQLYDTVTSGTITGTVLSTHLDDVTIHRAINDSGTATTDLWSASKINSEIESAISGMDFQPDVLDIQTDATLDPGASPAAGARYIITVASTLHANFGTITGLGNNDIVEYNGTAFVVSYDVSVAGEGALTWDRASNTYQRFDGSSWAEFGGLSGVTAGDGLTKLLNTLNVGAGDGIDVAADSISVDVTDIIGTGLSEDASNNIRIGSQGNGLTGGNGTTIAVAADSTTGATVAPVSVTANGVGVVVDNSSLTHTNGIIKVALVDGGTFA
jgi:hypothetical protein